MVERNPDKELFMSEKFGVELEGHRVIAEALFGEGVNLENLTEEQNAKIQAVNLGFHRGINKAFEEFFNNRKTQGNNLEPPSNS